MLIIWDDFADFELHEKSKTITVYCKSQLPLQKVMLKNDEHFEAIKKLVTEKLNLQECYKIINRGLTTKLRTHSLCDTFLLLSCHPSFWQSRSFYKLRQPLLFLHNKLLYHNKLCKMYNPFELLYQNL